MKRSLCYATLTAVLLSGGLTWAAKPTPNKPLRAVPNLASAHGIVKNACNRMAQAQKLNELDTTGHGAKAKALLEQAEAELKLAVDLARKEPPPTVKPPVDDDTKGTVTLPKNPPPKKSSRGRSA